MFNLIGKMVEVEANSITYTGKLVEMNETETHLLTENGWIVVMNQDILSVREIAE